MTEIAFLVKPDSEMYRKYFKQKNELDKFVGFASSFIDKYFVSRNKDFDYSFSTNIEVMDLLPDWTRAIESQYYVVFVPKT